MTTSIIKHSKFIEERGELYTTFMKEDFQEDFILDKVSVSKRGVIRGFHGDDYTTKLVSVLHGKVWFVVYDIEHAITERFLLSGDDEECKTILVPPNHLNGHQCLSDDCIFFYKWDQPYDRDRQYSVYYDDKTINPRWLENDRPIVSERDLNSQTLVKFLKERDNV